MDGASFVGVAPPWPSFTKGESLGRHFRGAVAGCVLYMKKETFGKGVLQRCSVFVSVRRAAGVIGTWCVSLGERGLSREKRLLMQVLSPEISPFVLPEGSASYQRISREATSCSLGLILWTRMGHGCRYMVPRYP